MTPQHEIDRLNQNIAWLQVQSELARICVPPVKVEQPIPLIDRRWFMACVYVVVAMVIGGLISLVIA